MNYITRSDIDINNIDIVSNRINILKQRKNKGIYHTIYFPSNRYFKDLKEVLTAELEFYLKKIHLKDNYHVFIVGLGNDSNTADAVGPLVIDYLNVNGYLGYMGIDTKIKVTALEPGVIGKTGIDTKRIIEGVVAEIKPDVVILIDSFVTKDIRYLNHLIAFNNKGITPGSGIKGINSEINASSIGVSVITIGVATALELKINKKDKTNYLLSTSNIDDYVRDIAHLIGSALNETFTL